MLPGEALQLPPASCLLGALAREAGLAIARDLQLSLNQVYLRSDPGMGKTHLAKAVAQEAARLFPARQKQIRYASAEGFTNEFVVALREKNTDAFRKRYRDGCRLLVIEDVQFLAHKAATQLEFFHTVQHVLDRGGKVMLTGDQHPSDLDQLDPRVQSQLSSGFVAELEAACRASCPAASWPSSKLRTPRCAAPSCAARPPMAASTCPATASTCWSSRCRAACATWRAC